MILKSSEKKQSGKFNVLKKNIKIIYFKSFFPYELLLKTIVKTVSELFYQLFYNLASKTWCNLAV